METSIVAARRARRPRAAAPKGGFDRARLDDQLEALRRETPQDDAAFRRDAVELFRQRLEGCRAEARRALEDGGTGRACAARLSDHEDNLIRAIHDWAARYFHPGLPTSARPTIVAVGGYGRGMLAPGSDIDLLFLLPGARRRKRARSSRRCSTCCGTSSRRSATPRARSRNA